MDAQELLLSLEKVKRESFWVIESLKLSVVCTVLNVASKNPKVFLKVSTDIIIFIDDDDDGRN